MERAGFLQGQDRGAAVDQRYKSLILFTIFPMNRTLLQRDESGMRWLPPRRGDVAAIILFAVLVAAYVCFVMVTRSGGLALHRSFGPEWNCTKIGRGEPICIKKSP
jgi:hypothetical protein